MSPQVFLTLSILLGSAAFAADPATPQKPTAPAGGVVVFIDPATGQVRQPDASEIKGLVPAPTVPAKAPSPLTLIQGPGGAVGVILGDEALTYMVATIAPEGKVAMDCVTGDPAAGARLATPAMKSEAAPKGAAAPKNTARNTALKGQDTRHAKDQR